MNTLTGKKVHIDLGGIHYVIIYKTNRREKRVYGTLYKKHVGTDLPDSVMKNYSAAFEDSSYYAIRDVCSTLSKVAIDIEGSWKLLFKGLRQACSDLVKKLTPWEKKR